MLQGVAVSLSRSRRLLPGVPDLGPDEPHGGPLQLEVSDRLTVSQVSVEVAYQTVRTGLGLWMEWRLQARACGVPCHLSIYLSVSSSIYPVYPSRKGVRQPMSI